MATIDEFLISLRAEFGEQASGKKFEVFCKWFLENDPEWSKKVDKVWLWDDYPNKWQRQDLGTDLIFRDREGLIWAVQAKCYAEACRTTKGDLNSFLADTGRKEVDKRLWLQTTNKMEAKARKTLKGQDKPVIIVNLNDFRDAPLDYPSSFSDLYQAKVETKPTPDTHQLEAIEAVQSKLQSLDRGQMIMACGTGKTFTTLWIKEALNAHTTLVLLPSLNLLSQTMREWAWAGNTEFEILNVCSDKSVGKRTEDMHPSEASFEVTSEVDEITKFLKKPDPKVVFCTYQSSPLIAQVQLDKTIPDFDLAIADEAHRCAGKADAGFATVLDAEQIRAQKRLFTTATPRYFGKAIKDAAKARDLAVIGMDDEEVFGPVIHKLTFGEAIQRDLLTDYQVVIVGVDEPMVKLWIDEQEIVATGPDEHTDARTLAAKIGLIKAIKDYDLKRVISFHSRIDGAKKFSEELVDVVDLIDPAQRPEGTFLLNYVSGKMTAGDRKEKIDKLKVLEGYDRGLLTNARCLAEGVDVPSLDGVAFIDPKGSQVDIIQAVGRAIRKVRGTAIQTKGTIVLPVFIEDGDDLEASIEASNFKPVWDVVNALRAHDNDLADKLDRYRKNMAKGGLDSHSFISDKLIFDLPSSIDVEFSNALRTVLVEATTASWEFWFGLLEVFQEREGHCRAAAKHKEDGYNLGNWIHNQRRREDNLSSDQIKRLDALGFVWDELIEKWEEGFSKLQQFYEREANCRVPRQHKEKGYRLGNWVGTQRSNRDDLSSDQIERLDAICFVWNIIAEQWEEGFSKLQQFYEREANCRVPQQHKEENYKLGTWVNSQRSNKNNLSSDRIKKLDALGFVWDVLAERWEEGLRNLHQFYEREGNCRVPALLKEDGFRLGSWVAQQRFKKDNLSSDQIKRLDALGFVWDELIEKWEEGFSKLHQFYEREANCRVPQQHKENGFSLGSWISHQKSKKDNLSPDRIERLDAIGFVWDALAERWEEGFSKLQQFYDREANCRVPQQHKEDDYELGNWISQQRSKKDNLSPDRIKRLDALGFVWDPFKEDWEEGFSKLQQFHQKHGKSRVPAKYKEGGYGLGTWVNSQRSKKNKLSPDQIKRLDALGFVWDPYEEDWEEGFSKLQQFHQRKGNCSITTQHEEDGYNLGNWVHNQRRRKDTLAAVRMQRLDALGFIWKAN